MTTSSTTLDRPSLTTGATNLPGVAEFYNCNGYFILENGFSASEVEEMRAEAARICSGEAGPIPGAEGRRAGETDDELLRRFLCIHFPHKTSDLMHRALSHPAVVDVLTQVIGPDVKCMQSMLFIVFCGSRNGTPIIVLTAPWKR